VSCTDNYTSLRRNLLRGWTIDRTEHIVWRLTTQSPGGIVVLLGYLIVAVLAIVFGVITARRRAHSKVGWEAAPHTGAAHDAAIADPQLLAFLEQKQLIAAIKRYRELTGVGLKESKDAVEALQRNRSGS
jgi:ribosomal protein L7/L12